MKRFLIAAAVLGIAACQEQGVQEVIEAEPMMVADEAIPVSGARKRSAAAAPPPSSGEAEAPVGQYLAYSYRAELRLPVEVVKPMVSVHEQACREAGPSVCQVLNSSVGGRVEDSVYGQLSFRASKPFMEAFRSGLAAEVNAAEGEVISESSSVEDLTRQITDTSARLDAQKKLRDRLLLLLEKDTDDIGDLLQVERELARVQGEIESTESYLKALEARVSMDRMDLRYQSIRKAVAPSTGEPLTRAFRDFFGIVAESLASVITFVAAALPWLIVAIPGFFIARRFLRAVFRRG
ncbi:DUF4349 domain-containing protein [Parvularcula sp. ZS-1/3]|uniref:DUF4349 domain-containing protein n=1 Tax=Parvularcula mediterranea TaxID=2732508 RepID=A0A7Y3RIP5_9PROT|nr:DUF4349 domain-containing protein [Parvularcula mediterranea]NNU14819.1 DUF4349 domain-containing protein [Parvularcula mediterranea]